MPQDFRVVRCYKCEVFQVQMVKKSIKWKCVICGDNQSLKNVYGTGTGKECRLHVQKLNEIRMNRELNADHDSLSVIKTDRCDVSFTQVEEHISDSFKRSNLDIDKYSQHSVDCEMSLPQKNNGIVNSKWAKYLENEPKHSEADSCNEDLFNGMKCVLELPPTKKARKTANKSFDKNLKKFKGNYEPLKEDIQPFQREKHNFQSSHGYDDEEYWDKVTEVNECWEEGTQDVDNELVCNGNVLLPLNSNDEASKWSKYDADVDNPNSHSNSNFPSDDSPSFSNLLNHDSPPITHNKNTEFDNKMVAGLSKWMKYIEAPEVISIGTNAVMITNKAVKCSNDLSANAIKISKWSKYLDKPELMADIAVDNKSTTHSGSESFMSYNNNSMDLIECKVLNQSNFEGHIVNDESLNIGSKKDIKSALSKFEIDKSNLKTKNTKYSSESTSKKLTVGENNKYVFDSFINCDDEDLENIFDI